MLEEQLLELEKQLQDSTASAGSIMESINIKWSSNLKKKLENQIKKFKDCAEGNIYHILAPLLVYIKLKGDEAIIFCRKRGLFGYYNEWGGTVEILKWLYENSRFLTISDLQRNYISHKYNFRSVIAFYSDCEETVYRFIKKHERRRILEKVGNVYLETNLVMELMALLDYYFRVPKSVHDYPTIAQIELFQELNLNEISSYSAEEIGEAISYLISKYNEKYKLSDKRYIWLDAEFVVHNKEIVDILLLAAKRNRLAEWELEIDYFGYDIEKCGEREYALIDSNRLEKSVRIGYVKTEMQETVQNISNLKTPDEVVFLASLAEEIQKLGNKLFILMD